MHSEHRDSERAHTRAERSRQDVKKELRHLMEDVEELMRRVGDTADPEIEVLRTRAQAAIASAREAVDGRTERARAYVHERPWRFAGMVGLLGMVAGFLFTRR